MTNDALPGFKRGLSRLWSTGKVAASAARLAARRVAGVEGDGDAALAEILARELDGMKGMAMKVGQIVSYFDGILPESAHAALRKLQQGARPVEWEVMAKQIEEAFGMEVDACFEQLLRVPIASASIGQVYRARWEGRDVAVKVQYPGIATSMDADFARIGHFAALASMATAVDGKALVAELRARVEEECDYQAEARSQAEFCAAFAHDPEIHVPEVFEPRTRATVLTTAWCDGMDFYTFVESTAGEQSRRNAVAQVLMRFAFRSLYGLGMLNADPHPGNYLLPRDGEDSVTFLDFGCVRRFEPEYLQAQRQLARVIIDGRRDEFRDAVMATGMVPNPKRFDFDEHWRMLAHELLPYRVPSFRFTPEHLAAGMDMGRPGNPNMRRIAIPPPWIWQQRLQWGLSAVLVRLAAEGDFRAIFREALESSP